MNPTRRRFLRLTAGALAAGLAAPVAAAPARLAARRPRPQAVQPTPEDEENFAKTCARQGGGPSTQPHASGNGYSFRCYKANGDKEVTEGPFYPED